MVLNPDPSSPRVIPLAEHGLQPRQFSPNALKVVARLHALGFEACIVGGCIRDLLLGHQPKDFDVATNATPEQIREAFKNARLIGRRFRLAHVRFGREIIEVATYRGDSSEASDDEPVGRDGLGARAVEQGRLVRDNVFGSEAEDASRRDFTINALMYDPSDETVRDYVGGYEDLKKRRLALIGDPEARYREDPVRLLRAIRFLTKLNLTMDPKTEAPIRQMAPLLGDIPPARLFDEMLKLFLTGQALATYRALVSYELWEVLFPGMLDDPAEPPLIIQQGLANTDSRLAQDLPVTPGFLFAVLLWPRVSRRADQLTVKGLPPVNALDQAADEVLYEQARTVAIHRRFSTMAREIWVMQPRFLKKNARKAERMVVERRFRAAYDFLLLRVLEEPHLKPVAQWWTDLQAEPSAPQPQAPRPKSKRRRPRRRRRPTAPSA